ncbi:MAG: hypothetical protein CMJ52_08335 [Planctomycetaceae bacterium]|nr:hypothetical protein [Planctomycetaceae bacterium]
MIEIDLVLSLAVTCCDDGPSSIFRFSVTSICGLMVCVMSLLTWLLIFLMLHFGLWTQRCLLILLMCHFGLSCLLFSDLYSYAVSWDKQKKFLILQVVAHSCCGVLLLVLQLLYLRYLLLHLVLQLLYCIFYLPLLHLPFSSLLHRPLGKFGLCPLVAPL